MGESFDILLSRVVAPTELAAALTDMIPPGLRVDVRADLSELPDEPGAVWAVTGGNGDPAWPCVLNVLVFGAECGMGPYPDLRIAGRLWEQFGTDALCGTYPFVGGLDPHDPYWSLALVGGKWHLASTAGTRLMGPYGGVRGDEPVRLVRPVTLPDAAA